VLLNEETIKERQALAEFKEHWAWISKSQPNLLIPKKKKTSSPVKKAAEMLALQLTPSALKLLSSEKLKTPVPLALLPMGQVMGRVIGQATGQATGQGKEQAMEPARGGRRATAGLKGRMVRVAVTDGTGQAQKQEKQVIRHGADEDQLKE